MKDDIKARLPLLQKKVSLKMNVGQVSESLSDGDFDDEEETKTVKKKKPDFNSNLPVVELNFWKKKNRIDPKSKVFVLMGGYEDVRKGLTYRGRNTSQFYSKKLGWVENTEPNSPCFDLK